MRGVIIWLQSSVTERSDVLVDGHGTPLDLHRSRTAVHEISRLTAERTWRTVPSGEHLIQRRGMTVVSADLAAGGTEGAPGPMTTPTTPVASPRT
jgi:hypothetical protein